MDIERTREDGELLWTLRGRLDAGNCRHLEEELQEALHRGDHRIALDMAEVPYMSSAGIRSLLLCAKTLKGLGGTFSLRRASPFVAEILDMTGMTALFAPPESVPPSRLGEGATRYDLIGGGSFRAEPLSPGAVRPFGAGVWGLGLGSFEGSPDRAGEMLGAEGFALMLPPEAGGTPDFMAASGNFLPRVHFASGLYLQGAPSCCLRFAESLPGIPLSRLALAALDAVGTSRAAVALLGETSGLVGASLAASASPEGPEEGPENPEARWREAAGRIGGEEFFALPAVRDHLDYRTEKRFDRHLVLAVGVALRGDPGPLGPLVRPLGGEEEGLKGHFHGAVFPFRPIPQGRVELRPVLATLLDALAPVGLLHLLHDRRPISGAGESTFLNGALWAGPLAGSEGTAP